MGRTIAISDIHGCCNTLNALLSKIAYTATDHLIVLGDLINRGPRSREVLDFFLSYQAKGYNITLLRGNHEVMFMEAFQDPEFRPRFLRAGGDATLKSFGLEYIRYVDERYLDLIHNMLDYYSDEDAVYVHAGLNFSLDNPFVDTEAMYWEREFKVIPHKIGNRLLIHGHTPFTLTNIMAMIDKKEETYEVNIDNGCVYSREGMNHLLAYFPQTGHFVVQKNID